MSKRRKAASDFGGFPKDTIRFLAELKTNNNREWFAENRQRYETSLKQPAERFAAALCDELAELTAVAQKSRIFRIHRDIRFSKDKTPYNPHLHIGFMPHEGSPATGWYFGLYPQRATIGAGMFTFGKKQLPRFRERLDGEDGDELRRICDALVNNGHRLSEPELKRVPPPFSQEHPDAAHLRRKSLAAWRDFDDPAWLAGPMAVAKCMESFKMLKPLNDWLSAL